MAKYKFSIAEKVGVWEAYKRRCIYCSELIPFKDLHIDHILPESIPPDKLSQIAGEYGLQKDFDLNSYFNWVPSHSRCNLMKAQTIFSKPRAMFFLEQAEKLHQTAIRYGEQYKQRSEREKILITLALSIEKGFLSVEEISGHLNAIEAGQYKFKLIRPLEFAGQTIIDRVGKNDAAELLDRVVKIGDPHADGLELINGKGNIVIVRTCREFNDAKANGFYATTTYGLKMQSFLNQTCGIINALVHASVADKSYLENPHVGVIDINLMPLSVLNPLSRDDHDNLSEEAAIGKSLREWVEEGKVEIKGVSQYSIHLRYGCMGQIIWELIRADLNDDGIEDILVYSYSYAIGGSFGYGDVGCLTRMGAMEPFKQISMLGTKQNSWQSLSALKRWLVISDEGL
jgi:hypothetical protein